MPRDSDESSSSEDERESRRKEKSSSPKKKKASSRKYDSDDDSDGGDAPGSGEVMTPREAGLYRRHTRHAGLVRVWSQFLDRREYLSLGDSVHIQMRGDPPATYALTLQSVLRCQIRSELMKRLRKDAHELEFALNVSFFHAPSKRFFGSTWQTGRYKPTQQQKSGGHYSLDVQFNELVFWYTYIDDPETLVITELVGFEVDPQSQVTFMTFGCGWGAIRPFNQRGLIDVSQDTEDVLDVDTYSEARVIDGSPRLLAKDTIDTLTARSTSEISLRYRVLQHQALITARHLIPENTLVGARDLVPGLRKTKLEFPPNPKLDTNSYSLGYEVVKTRSVSDDASSESKAEKDEDGDDMEITWGIRARRRVKFDRSPPLRLSVSKIRVIVEDLHQMENLIDRRLHNHLKRVEPELYVSAISRTTLAARAVESVGQELSKQTTMRVIKVGWRVLARRLRFGIHNGYQLSSGGGKSSTHDILIGERNKQSSSLGPTTIELAPIKSNGKEKRDAVVELNGLTRSTLCALVVNLEVHICPTQTIVVPASVVPESSDEKHLTDDWLATYAKTFRVVIGSGSHIPWDGTRLRLRSTQEVQHHDLKDFSKNDFQMELSVDGSTHALARLMPEKPLVWPGSGDGKQYDGLRDDSLDKPYRAVKFRCEAFEDKDEIQDETPSPPEDEPEEGLTQRMDSGSEAESSSSSSSSSEDESRSRSPSVASSRSSLSSRRHRRPKHIRTTTRRHSPDSDRSPSVDTLETGDIGMSKLDRYPTTPRRHTTRHVRTPYIPDSPPSPEMPWKATAPATKRGESLLAHTLFAPVHTQARPLVMPQQPYPPVLLPTGVGVMGGPQPQELTRAGHARLHRFGVHEVPQQPGFEDESKLNVDLELNDDRTRNEIIFRFAAYRAAERHGVLPSSVFFSYRFFEAPLVRSKRGVLRMEPGQPLRNDVPHVLVPEGPRGNLVSQVDERLVVDTSLMSESEAREFFEYLAGSTMQVDVWDGDSLTPIGCCAVPLRPLLRQGSSSVKKVLEYQVVEPFGQCDSTQPVSLNHRGLPTGTLAGYLQLVTSNFGEYGAGKKAGSLAKHPASKSHPPTSTDANWRFASTSTPTEAQNPSKRPAHRKRARPMSQTTSVLGASEPAKPHHRHVEGIRYPASELSPNAITYDQILLLAKRFRDPLEKGRVAYVGRLLRLMDAPDITSLENAARKDLAALEQRGKSLEQIAQALDAYGNQRIRSVDVIQTLSRLCPSLRKRRPKQLEMELLVSRIDTDRDGMIPLADLVEWARGRKLQSPTVATIRKVLFMVQSRLQIDPLDAFAKYDEQSSGFLDLDKLIKVIQDLSESAHIKPPSPADIREMVTSLQAQTQKGVSLVKVLNHFGLTYKVDATPRLKAFLVKNAGFLENHFAGTSDEGLSVPHFLNLLRLRGLFRVVSKSDAQQILSSMFPNQSRISLRQLFDFMGKQFDEYLQQRLRATLIEGVAMGLNIDMVFDEWAEKETKLTQSQCLVAIHKLGTTLFTSTTREDVVHLFEEMGGGESVEKAQLAAFVRKDEQVFLKAKLKHILLSVEKEKGDSIHNLFQEWDTDKSESLDMDELVTAFTNLGVMASITREEISKAFGSSVVHFRDMMELLGRNFASYVEFRLHDLIEKAGLPLQSVFNAFDTDGDGTLSSEELRGGLKKIPGFEDVTPEDVQALMKRASGEETTQTTGNGGETVSLTAFCRLFGQEFVPANSEAKLIQVLRRAASLGFNMSNCFDELDLDGNGSVTADELVVGFSRLGEESKGFLDVNRADLESLVRSMGDPTSMTITRKQFLYFAASHNLPFDEDSVSGQQDQGGGEEKVDFDREEMKESEGKQGEDDAEEEGDTPDQYQFSPDPETAAIERKVRRVAQAYLQNRRGKHSVPDLEALFKQYDLQQKGSVLRSEFVNVLMQMGLSLLDVPETVGGAPSGGSADELRKRRLLQLAKAKGQHASHSPDVKLRRMEGGSDDMEGLALLKWYREGQKKHLVRQMIEAGIKTEYHLHPRFANSVFFEHTLSNPFNQNDRFIVQLDPKCRSLRLISDCEEWTHFRRHVKPPPGVGEDVNPTEAVESDMFYVDPSSGPQLQVMARETVRVPFCLLVMDPRAQVNDTDQTAVIKFVSATHGMVVAMMEVHIHPRPPLVHRTLRFYQSEGALVKRCVRLLLPQNSAAKELNGVGVGGGGGGLLQHMGVGRRALAGRMGELVGVDALPMQGSGSMEGKFVQSVSVDGTSVHEVMVEARDLPDGSQEIYLKFAKLGAFPSTSDVYLVVFNDHHRASLFEVWHVKLASRLKQDLHTILGQSATLDLTLRGDRHLRRVRAFASNEKEISFDPSGEFDLAPGMFNRIGLTWTPVGAIGTRYHHIHLVDVDTQQLVCAWLLCAAATPPAVTKEFDLSVPIGEPAHKKIMIENPWSMAQAYRLRSSDPALMRPKTEVVQIEGHGYAHVRLYIAPPERRGITEVFLMVNDDSDQNDECFRILIRAT